jgi:hypothetical protein
MIEPINLKVYEERKKEYFRSFPVPTKTGTSEALVVLSFLDLIGESREKELDYPVKPDNDRDARR